MPVPPPTRPRLLHLGGSGPLLHLAHANGFPPGAYAPLARALAPGFRVIALPSRPLWAGPLPPPDLSWDRLAADLADGLWACGQRDLVGVGHSFGVVLTALAALRRPGLFRSLVLLDPVLLHPAWLVVTALLRPFGLHGRLPLAEGARRRRRTFVSRAAAREHFRSRRLFERFGDAALDAYVDAVLRPDPAGGLTLAFPPAWEAHLYGSVPTDLWTRLPRLPVPTAILVGEHTDVLVPESRALLGRAWPTARLEVLPGAGHLHPLERPEATAAFVQSFIASC